MGNANNANIKTPFHIIQTFITKENSKWTRISTNIKNGEQPGMSWDDYIEIEMKSTEEEWGRLRGMHGYQTQSKVNMTASRSGHEEALKMKSFQISKLSSDRERLNNRNQELETRYKDMSKKINDFDRENKELKKRIQDSNGVPRSNYNQGQNAHGNISPEAAQKVMQLRNQLIEKEDEIQIQKANNESLEMHVKFVEEEKAALLHRLSKMAGDRLLDNNPAIADLSDPNRPTKLGEFYGELYDNEWTNSFDKLHNSGYEEDVAADTLQLTLMNVFKFCETKAGMVLKQATDAVNLLFKEYKQSIIDLEHIHLSVQQNRSIQSASALGKINLQDRWKAKNPDKSDKSDSQKMLMSVGMDEKKERLKAAAESKLIQLRKEVAVSMVPIVQEAYMEASWDPECLEEMKPFILKCLHLSWMMVVQSPPMALATCETGDTFDKTQFREYTKSGSVVASMVWPALLLQKDGPIVVKGVAQAK